MSHRRAIKPAYIWGSLSNTEPPEDDEEVIGYYDDPETYEIEPDLITDDAYAASAAEDRDTAWRDSTASQ